MYLKQILSFEQAQVQVQTIQFSKRYKQNIFLSANSVATHVVCEEQLNMTIVPSSLNCSLQFTLLIFNSLVV